MQIGNPKRAVLGELLARDNVGAKAETEFRTTTQIAL
jgi:hypothetical protein